MWGTVTVFIPLPLAVPVAALLFGGSMRIVKDRKQLEAGTPSYLSTQRSVSWRSVSSAAVTYTVAYNMNVLAQTSICAYVVTVPVGHWLLLRGLRTVQTLGPRRGPNIHPPSHDVTILYQHAPVASTVRQALETPLRESRAVHRVSGLRRRRAR